MCLITIVSLLFAAVVTGAPQNDVIVAVGQCPSGWLVHDDICYMISHDQEQWHVARTICQSYNSYLLEINTQREQTFIEGIVKRIGEEFWMGGNDRYQLGTWVWSHNQTVIDKSTTYTNWDSGSPGNLGEESCMNMIDDGKWDGTECFEHLYYICERPRINPGMILG